MIMHIRGIFLIIWQILSSFGFWGSIEVVGAGLVAYGCINEFRLLASKSGLDHHRGEPKQTIVRRLCRPFVEWAVLKGVRLNTLGHPISPSKEHHLERRYANAVAIGVSIELVALFVSLPEIAQIRKDAALANDRAKSNELQVVIAQSNLAALQLQVQWRTITAEQQASLIKRLRPLAVELPNGEKEITIETIGDNPEARQFAVKLAFVMGACGFNVFLNQGLTLGFRQGVGVFLGVKDKNRPPPHAEPILRAFEESKIGPLQTDSVAAKDGELVIVVFQKPEN
jgi:hypothetical protein